MENRRTAEWKTLGTKVELEWKTLP